MVYLKTLRKIAEVTFGIFLVLMCIPFFYYTYTDSSHPEIFWLAILQLIAGISYLIYFMVFNRRYL